MNIDNDNNTNIENESMVKNLNPIVDSKSSEKDVVLEMSQMNKSVNGIERLDSEDLGADAKAMDYNNHLDLQIPKKCPDPNALWEDQCTVDYLEVGGTCLQSMRLTKCCERKLKVPDILSNIELEVPFTKAFSEDQIKSGFQKRRTNRFISSKYTPWTFIPMASVLQFKRFTNAFYLVLTIIALVGYYITPDGNTLWIVPFDPVTLIILIVVVVAFSLIFEGKDDFARHKNDSLENNKKIQRVRGGIDGKLTIEEVPAGTIMPGDMIFVEEKSNIPSDILIIASYGADKNGSTCYVETSGIDGETNLKIKEVCKFVQQKKKKLSDIQQMYSNMKLSSRALSQRGNLEMTKTKIVNTLVPLVYGTYYYEQPNSFLQFNGTFTPFNSSATEFFGFENMILRGSQLRNTKWVLGIVMYAGPETKLALSRKPTPNKFGLIDRFMNRLIGIVAICYILLCIISVVCLYYIAPNTGDWWYFDYSDTLTSFLIPGYISYFLTYVILFSNFIPIPIIICVEAVNFYCKIMFDNDLEMYHPETNTRAICQTSQLVAEIGQITHIFSDKTGTLTRNKMKMIGCYVKGKFYGDVPPELTNDDDVFDDESTSTGIDSSHEASISGVKNVYSSSVVVDPSLHHATTTDSEVSASVPVAPGTKSANNFSNNVTKHQHQQHHNSINQNTIGAVLKKKTNSASGENFDDGNDDDDNMSTASNASLKLEEIFSYPISLLAENFDEADLAKSEEREALYEYFLLLALCHTVVIDYDEDGNIDFNAESPDEEAFVKCAASLGLKLVGTEEGFITVEKPGGEVMKYQILGVNPFNSTRKRMSIVIQCVKTKEIHLLMKGADNVMMERLIKPTSKEEILEHSKVDEALARYSWNGLRTLVMGKRKISEKEFLDWSKKRADANFLGKEERVIAIAESAASIEKDIELLGCSAIEDQLQQGVPEAVQTLRDSGCQVWVLTGDKVETAINIGLSSNLIDQSMIQIKLTSSDINFLNRQLDEILSIIEQTCQEKLEEKETGLKKSKSSIMRRKEDEELGININELQQDIDNNSNSGVVDLEGKDVRSYYDIAWNSFWSFFHLGHLAKQNPKVNAALIISGKSLEILLKEQKGNAELEAKLLHISRICKVVLACRVSPAQKALVVEMVRYAPDAKQFKAPITLAIGDGANDVPMIQSAHVGVGISGNEGLQAARSADFAIAQFRFLSRMLVVHGRWNYQRQANVINFVIYTWFLYCFLLFCYLPISAWSGQQIFAYSIYTGTFAYFANVYIVVHVCMDRDLTAESALSNPWVYAVGVNSIHLNYRKLFTTFVRSLIHWALIFLLVFRANEPSITLDEIGTQMFTSSLLVIMMTSISASSATFTKINVLLWILVLIVFLVFIRLATSLNPYKQPLWGGIVISIFSVLILEMFVKYAQKEFFPSLLDILIEIDRGYFKGSKHARKGHLDALNVLEQVTELSIKPVTVGAKRIKVAFKERNKATDLEGINSTSQRPYASMSSISSTAHKMSSAFGSVIYRMPSKQQINNRVSQKLKALSSSSHLGKQKSQDEDELKRTESLVKETTNLSRADERSLLSTESRIEINPFIPGQKPESELEILKEEDEDNLA